MGSAAVLRRDPSMLLCVQRGQRYLKEKPSIAPETLYLEVWMPELARLRELQWQGGQE
jgi:hypothetical protein